MADFSDYPNRYEGYDESASAQNTTNYNNRSTGNWDAGFESGYYGYANAYNNQASSYGNQTGDYGNNGTNYSESYAESYNSYGSNKDYKEEESFNRDSGNDSDDQENRDR